MAQAVQWYTRAADAGSAIAMLNLGVLYDSGRGVAKDGATAMQWYRRAAALGELDAIYSLGAHLVNGDLGEKDAAAGMEWIRRAADRGHALSKAALVTLAPTSNSRK
jgi:TPR repeat protein